MPSDRAVMAQKLFNIERYNLSRLSGRVLGERCALRAERAPTWMGRRR